MCLDKAIRIKKPKTVLAWKIFRYDAVNDLYSNHIMPGGSFKADTIYDATVNKYEWERFTDARGILFNHAGSKYYPFGFHAFKVKPKICWNWVNPCPVRVRLYGIHTIGRTGGRIVYVAKQMKILRKDK